MSVYKVFEQLPGEVQADLLKRFPRVKILEYRDMTANTVTELGPYLALPIFVLENDII